MRTRSTAAAALALAALLIAGPSPASSQGSDAPTPEPLEITTGLLARLAIVYPTITGLAADAEHEIAAAETDAVARGIQEAAEERIVAVLAEVDLTAAEYVAAIRTLNADERLRARFRRMLDAAEAGGR